MFLTADLSTIEFQDLSKEELILKFGMRFRYCWAADGLQRHGNF